MSYYNTMRIHKVATNIFDNIIEELENIGTIETTAPKLSTPDRTTLKSIITDQLDEIVEHYDSEIEDLEYEIKENAPKDLIEQQMFDDFNEKIDKYRRGL